VAARVQCAEVVSVCTEFVCRACYRVYRGWCAEVVSVCTEVSVQRMLACLDQHVYTHADLRTQATNLCLASSAH